MSVPSVVIFVFSGAVRTSVAEPTPLQGKDQRGGKLGVGLHWATVYGSRGAV